ncbi:ring finger protein 146 [Musca autumnalis]|uniref:ring finger protein 146 n=1 Tax=Musca autumnalis TaxID=221902 RepID=UPI003CEB3085
MENLEDDAQEVTTAGQVVAVAATTITPPSLSSVNNQNQAVISVMYLQQQQYQQQNIENDGDLDESVIIIEPHIDVVDLTEPTTSAGTGAAMGLLKPKIENPSKDATSSSTSSTLTNENPSTSGLTTSSADAAGGAAMSSTTSGGAANSTTTTSNQLECPICLQTCIHPARLPCGHIFCFLCVKGVAYKNRRCAMCRREIPPEFLDHPQLVNGIEDICSTKATDDGYQWFYEGRNGWWQYDDRTSQDLEEAFKKGERSCTILVAGYVYIVDFDAMIQQRQNEPARCRRVKRDLATIPKKGVAGLRIEGNTVTTDSNFAQQVYRQSRYHNDDLDLHENALMGGAHSMDANNTQGGGPLRLTYGLGGYVINPSELVSTAAATDAALRIASDIIGSTLAHADELTRSTNSNHTGSSSYQQQQQQQHQSTANNSFNPTTGELNLNDLALISSSSSNNSSNNTSNQQLARLSGSLTGGLTSTASPTTLPRERGSRELLGAAEDLLGATQRVIATADQPTIDLFEQTLNDFHALTLRNIVDSSDDDDGLHHHQQQQHQQLYHHQQRPPLTPPPRTPPANLSFSNSSSTTTNGQRSASLSSSTSGTGTNPSSSSSSAFTSNQQPNHDNLP